MFRDRSRMKVVSEGSNSLSTLVIAEKVMIIGPARAGDEAMKLGPAPQCRDMMKKRRNAATEDQARWMRVSACFFRKKKKRKEILLSLRNGIDDS